MDAALVVTLLDDFHHCLEALHQRVAQLDPVSLDHSLIDKLEHGWGWVGIDSVSIPGTPVSPPTELKLISHSFDTSSNQVSLTFASAPLKTYQITSSSDLKAFATVLKTPDGAPGADQTSTTVNYAPGPRRFIRVEELDD